MRASGASQIGESLCTSSFSRTTPTKQVEGANCEAELVECRCGGSGELIAGRLARSIPSQMPGASGMLKRIWRGWSGPAKPSGEPRGAGA